MSKAGKNASRRDSIAAAKSGGVEADPDDDDVEEESWTFVGGGETDIEDLDPETVARRSLAELGPAHGGVGGYGRGRGRPALGSRVLSGAGAVGTVGTVGARGVGVS